ncbi:hypothetical protein F0562_024640 [Nyssa sinensis]|uniref:Uncharacterized protein n=1 Tax=Nyssa sinensis TaxID=561372 RepID=A0A5J5BH27_9ASTE|nr:hypothetical protein F0562_024640 [Nyssa sinensis]
MHQALKTCHTKNTSNIGTRRKAASMLVYLHFVAASVASRLVSAVWTFSAVIAAEFKFNRGTVMRHAFIPHHLLLFVLLFSALSEFKWQ